MLEPALKHVSDVAAIHVPRARTPTNHHRCQHTQPPYNNYSHRNHYRLGTHRWHTCGVVTARAVLYVKRTHRIQAVIIVRRCSAYPRTGRTLADGTHSKARIFPRVKHRRTSTASNTFIITAILNTTRRYALRGTNAGRDTSIRGS